MGEEIDYDRSQSSDSHSFKFQGNLFHKAPSITDVLQETTDSTQGTKNKGHVTRTDYDKLCLSLLSGLPNEQELALNVCTILSNEGNYMLHLEQAPKLVDLLIAQCGVWPLGDDSLKMVHLESWKNLKGRNIHRFWRGTIDVQNEKLMQLLGLDLGDYDPDCTLLNLESDLGAHNVEGQRVLRVALILHNLSFEKNNVPVLVSNKNFIRFLLLGIHSSWGNLRQIAYDTLSNLACAIKLSIEKDVCCRMIFQTVMDGILSLDRYMNVRSMDILAHLCGLEANEDIIPSRIDIEVYQQMVSFLSVHDIMLLFYTLEALYALSDLGRYACDKIVSVHRCIGALVSLLTLEPSEYGPSGQINMKVVKTMVPAEFDSEQEATVVSEETATSTSTTAPTTTPTPTTTVPTAAVASPAIVMPMPNANEIDPETFVVNWLKAAYELTPGKSVTRNELYSDYITYCTKCGRKDIANANVFTEYLKKTFPSCSIRKTELKGIFTFHHDGLYRKHSFNPNAVVVPKSAGITNTTPKVVTPTASCRPNQNTSFNSILKSQLSSAPRSNVSSPLKSPTPSTLNQKVLPSFPTPCTSPKTTAPTPSNAGSSTLIKSLLASKVQQRNLPSQVLPQNVSKMVIYTPGNSGILGSTTTVVRCIRPGALHAVNIGTQLRSPLIVSNNGRIIANATPRMVKSAAVIRPNMQTQVVNVQPQMINLHSQVVNTQSQATSVQPPATTIQSQVANGQTQVTNVHSQVTNGQNQVVNMQTQVANMQAQIANLLSQSQVTTVQQPHNAQTQVANMQTQIANLLSQSQVTNVLQPQMSNVQKLQVTNMQQPQMTTGQQPQVTNVHQSQATTVQQSQMFTIQQPQAATVQQSHVITMQQPQVNTMQQPQVAALQQPQVAALQQPQVATLQQPQVATLQQPQVNSMQQPQLTAMHQPQVTTMQQPQVTYVHQSQVANTHQSQMTYVQQSQVANVQQLQVSKTESQVINIHPQLGNLQLQLSNPQPQVANAQTQAIKQSVICSSSPRINGLLRDMQMEDEIYKISADIASTPVSNINLEQNHISKSPDINQHSTLPNGECLLSTRNIDQNNEINLFSSSVIQENPDLSQVIVAKGISTPEGILVVNSKSVGEISPIKDQKEFILSFENKLNSGTNFTLEQPQSTNALSSPTSILKSVLSDLEPQTDHLKQQQLQKDICKRAPLLNGLLDKGKLPTTVNLPSNTVILNGNESATLEVVNNKVENKSPQFVQLNQNFVIPVSSLNTVISPQQSNLILMPVSSVNSVITSSSINSSIFAAASVNSPTTFISSSNATVPLTVPNPVLPSTFLSNGSNVMQLCIGQTTLSGTAEVQSDQQGVVRLHIESPENSNQGSDLSSISDITRTLECASKALLKTNAECNSQVSFSNICEGTSSTTVATTSSPVLSRTGQQFFVVTPSLNQSQIQLQQPNIKFHILHSVPKIEESVDLISFPNVSLSQSNQLQQPSIETSVITSTSLKRPSSDTSPIQTVSSAKKLCIETKTSLLAESLRTPTSVPCTFDLTSVSSKTIQETKPVFVKSQLENPELISKLTSTKTVAKQVQKMDLPCEKGARTLSGLSSVNNVQSQAQSSHVPPKSTTGLEFLCEWKNCGLKFQTPGSVFLHASKVHTPLGSNDMVCLWEGCDSVKRKRLSLLTHVQDWHCNEAILQTQALRRKQIAHTGKSAIPPPQKPPPHPGYAPDAALLAIKRHALQYINPKELSEEKESVLTKSIRITSALILRNLVTHSTLARSHVRRFEPELAYLAMSPVESARTLAQCLSQLYSTHD